MRTALWSPGNWFDDGGHRPAVVGTELRPRGQRQSQHLSGTDVAQEVTLMKIKVGPGNLQQRLRPLRHAESPAGHH
ncbi:hypothetical protein [Paenarthrobacter sp. 4246]|uniref:hypothetical protein n=1 Tax=Paenarthrobacter sp. 4246 TaxID=3156456 RepID=UPI0033990268